MLNINASNLRTYAQELEKLLSQYEENSMIIAKEMQDAETIWHDDNSEAFFQNITKQKSELKDFIKSLQKVNTTYEDIISKINKIKSNMNTIFVDESKRSSIKSSYNTAINNLYSIRNRLSSFPTYFCTYYERSMIRSEVSRLGNAAKSLETARNNIETLFSKFSALEGEITRVMSKIEISTISNIDFSEYL